MTAHRIILDLEKRLERQENLHAEASLALDVLQHDKKISQLIHGETRKRVNEKGVAFTRDGSKTEIGTRTMKKELGDWTRRFFLCLSFSSSAGGLSRSMSFWSTCARNQSHNQIEDAGDERRNKFGSRRGGTGDDRNVPSCRAGAGSAAAERSGECALDGGGAATEEAETGGRGCRFIVRSGDSGPFDRVGSPSGPLK